MRFALIHTNYSQAHLHVSEVEEVVHVSGGGIFVIRDKNLLKKHNIFLDVRYFFLMTVNQFVYNHNRWTLQIDYLGATEHFVGDVLAGFHNSVTIQLQGNDRTFSGEI